MVIEGDSITAGSNGPPWIWQSVSYTRGRYFLPRNFNQATGGQTAAQMATQIADITALNPKVVNFLAGTNDLGGSSDTPSTIWGNIKTCIKGYIDGGASWVVVGTVMPRNDATWTGLTREGDRNTLNGLIRGYASDSGLVGYTSKIKVVDLESYDPDTDSIEGLHPNWLGAIKIGTLFGAAHLSLIDKTSVLTDLYLDSTSLAIAASKNAAMTGTGGGVNGTPSPTGQIATNWTLTQNDALTVVASKTTLNGAEAQKFVVSGTNGTNNHAVQLSMPVAYSGVIGDTLELACDFSLATGHQNIRNITMSCDTASVLPTSLSTAVMDGAGALSGTLRTQVTTPLTGTDSSTNINLIVQFATGTVAAELIWARPYIRKIPTDL
jgi:hypothetical protein